MLPVSKAHIFLYNLRTPHKIPAFLTIVRILLKQEFETKGFERNL